MAITEFLLFELTRNVFIWYYYKHFRLCSLLSEYTKKDVEATIKYLHRNEKHGSILESIKIERTNR